MKKIKSYESDGKLEQSLQMVKELNIIQNKINSMI